MLKHLTACAALVAATSTATRADEFATSFEARGMLERAIVAVNADKLGAIAKFNHNDPAFRDRDLFVFCFNTSDGKFTAHEAMVSQDVRTLRDRSGKPFGEDIYRSVKEGQIAEVAYVWPLPGSTRYVLKSAYVSGAGDQACGVSAYR